MPFDENALAAFVRHCPDPPGIERLDAHEKSIFDTFKAAVRAISLAFGESWVEQHVNRLNTLTSYFKAELGNRDQSFRYISRTVELAEVILNLYAVAGFAERVDLIKTDHKTGVESGIAELFAGKLLKLAGVKFSYAVKAVGASGHLLKNADIRYFAADGRVEDCEVKCNLGDTELSARSIENSLHKARGQMTPNKAGVILHRVPESWLKDAGAGIEVVTEGVNNFIEKSHTSRVSSIFVFASETKFPSPGQMTTAFMAREFRNRHCATDPGFSVVGIEKYLDVRWDRLQTFVKKQMAAAGR